MGRLGRVLVKAENLIYYLPTKVSSGYGDVTELRRNLYSEIIHALKTDSIHSPLSMKGVATSHCGQFMSKFYIFRVPQHIMLLDIDSISSRDLAEEHLNQEGIEYTCMESSPGRFWEVCNVVGSFSEVYHKAEIIPGVDSEYLRMSYRLKRFSLRCHPKRGQAPSFCDLSFLDVQGFKFNPYISWLNSFFDFWKRDEVKKLVEIAGLGQSSPSEDSISVLPSEEPEKDVKESIVERILHNN